MGTALAHRKLRYILVPAVIVTTLALSEGPRRIRPAPEPPIQRQENAARDPVGGIGGVVAGEGAKEGLGRLPIRFEPLGETGGFTCQARGLDALFTRAGAEFFGRSERAGGVRKPLIISFLGACSARPEGEGLLASTSNYLLGRDPARWRTSVPNYSAIKYSRIYPGIDALYYGRGDGLEVDFDVDPGADPALIRLGVAGTYRAELDNNGNVVLSSSGDDAMVIQRPVIYQEIRGVRKQVAGGYTVQAGGVGLWVAPHDAGARLVIDPVLDYSTYIGSPTTSIVTAADSVAIDSSGCIYVAGTTDAPDFPTTPEAFETRLKNLAVAFVAKFNPQATELIYSTFLQGQSQEQTITVAEGVAVDPSGCAYVAGETQAPDFPVTSGAFQTAFGGGQTDAFMLKLNPAGTALVYSTLLGGSGDEFCGAIDIDVAGRAVMAGTTSSKDFPVTLDAFLARTATSGTTGFIARVSPDGSKLDYSTYLGGSGSEGIFQAKTDAAGNIYVAGKTSSSDFPTTLGAFQREKIGPNTGFVTKLSPSGILAYSTLLGGGKNHYIGWIALNPAGEVYVAGATNSKDFPTTRGAYQERLAGNWDILVAKLSADGHSLVFSTFIGGRDYESPGGIAVGDDGSVYIVGSSLSSDYPTTPDAIQKVNRGGINVVVSRLSADGSKLVYSTYLGGESDDFGNAMALDPGGNAVIVGEADSLRFPTTSDAILQHTASSSSAFLSIIEPSDFALTLNPSQITLSPGEKAAVEISVERKGGLVGPVEITPPEGSVPKIRISPAETVATEHRNVSFTIRAKPGAAPGEYPLVFSATDKRGVISHEVTLTVVVQ